ncbi:MAG: ABC transporter ATP-binding protein [Rhodobacteraceae bacterium]|jgi:oligopeptide/dipeptide ABC transporter ATP-binding protein|uniref:ABC transporter ATP-binding protein n=1 Tax=Albidovulum sp. TaxID=1872424 RepID=UPI001E06ACF8|nr:ABC transporter ATP-binding protein [uncultured Defluviimonas sp.]MCB2124669.1 ABC transporter ATP-binding protein [Paracoccaceae bacterium]MCC0071463.1 ABC transporter ATP-binding protein [Paracoccaceae bacterium]
MTALLSVRDLAVDLPLGRWFGGGARALNILAGVTMDLQPGRTLGLVGESGSGKTTLARAILGLQPVSGGTLRFDGAELRRSADFRAIRRRTALMFQDATASLSPRMTVGEAVTEPFVIHGIRIASRRGKAAELLAEVGLPAEMAARYPHELSGGQARRVGVARALALKPSLVIADEPTAGLDVSVQAEILNLMADLKDRHGLSYLVITHNLALVRHVADRIAVLYLGRLVETGPTRAIFAGPGHPYTRSLIAAEPKPDPRQRRTDLAIRGEIPGILRRPPGCEFHTRCPVARDICRSAAPALHDLGPGHSVRCHFPETTSKGG